MCILSTLSCWTCHLLVGQHSAPYIMVGRIAVLYNLPFSFCGTLGSQDNRSLASLEPAGFNFITNIFIDIPILLEHRSQVAKNVFLGYQLTTEYSVLDLLSLKLFASKVCLHKSNFLSSCECWLFSLVIFSCMICWS
jgi:hypothetical protein